MKIWREELSFEYEKYLFGYCTYALPEEGDTLEKLYTTGFLPASKKEAQPRQFYMARSIRIPLKEFEMTSENRRVEDIFNLKRVPVTDFNFDDTDFRGIALPYMSEVLNIDGEEKLKQVEKADVLTDVVMYTDENDKPQGYVFLIHDGNAVHYWLSFFSIDLVKKSFGIWMMLQEIQQAQKEGKGYIYLGTCYGQKGRYKLNFTPFEFWNGESWIRDIEQLKDLLKSELL